MWLAAAACGGEGSNLERRAIADSVAEKSASGDPPTPAAKGPAPPAPTGAQPGPAVLVSAGEGERHLLKLGLAAETEWRVATIGLLALPGLQQPVGFARQEIVELEECDGEGSARTCTAVHRTVAFQGEPPAGGTLEAGEAPMLQLTFRQRIDATGRALEPARIEGDPAARARPDMAALVGAHQLFCLRLPSEPVGVGAVWKDECRIWSGQQLVVRDVEWTLRKLDVDPDGAGRRAELAVKGLQLATDADGNPRRGSLSGVLFLWADPGEPHLYEELVRLPLGDQGLETKMRLRVQFARPDPAHPDDPQAIVRTDGRAFPSVRTLGELDRVDPAPTEPLGEPAPTAPPAQPPTAPPAPPAG